MNQQLTSPIKPLATVPIRSMPLPAEYPGAHALDGDEEEALLRVCRSRSLYRYYGIQPQHETSSFEHEFAGFTGAKYALALTSGTAALHTALTALRVGPGQEVIIPAYLWVSIASAVVNVGAIPVVADIDDTFSLDPVDVERRLTSRTSAILFAHMSGAPGNVREIVALARRHGVAVIEDCAQCVGGTIDGQSVGTFGEIGIFSFQINKNISSGEGGALVTNDAALFARAIAAHDVGYARDVWEGLDLNAVDAWSWGRGYRMDELRAAVLRVQLRKLPSTLEHLRASRNRICKALARQPRLRMRRVADPRGDTASFLLTIYPDAAMAHRVNARLRWHGIACSSEEVSNMVLSEYGLHIYSNIPGLVEKIGTDNRGTPWTLEANRESVYDYHQGACPVADDLFSRTQLLAIPSCMTSRDEQDVIEAFLDALRFADR